MAEKSHKMPITDPEVLGSEYAEAVIHDSAYEKPVLDSLEVKPRGLDRFRPIKRYRQRQKAKETRSAYDHEVAEHARLSMLDSLTGLPNRRAFVSRFEDSAALAERIGRPLAVVMVDIIDLKGYNDKNHAEGDEAICTVAKAMETVARSHEYPARVGGDEFAISAINGDLGVYIDRLQVELKREEYFVDGQPVGVYIGFADSEQEGGTYTVYERAQAKLSAAKKSVQSGLLSS